MTVRVLRDADASLSDIAGERVAVIGYGIQGRAQSLNLRDSGVNVVVGNRRDDYAARARADGFDVLPITEAATAGRIVVLLIPDEAQPDVFPAAIGPHLEEGDGLVLAHGFSIRYGFLDMPPNVDLMLLAPRMPGKYVRERYLAGSGVPAYVDVAHDASGRAWKRVLALAKAIGATRAGVLAVSFEHETELDLFSEHFTFPLVFRALELAFEELVAAGYHTEVAVMELHGSGELGQVLEEAGRIGLYRMLERRASPAGRYGVLRHRHTVLDPEATRQLAQRTLARIRDGSFARELVEDHRAGHPELDRMTQESRELPLTYAEAAFRKLLHREDSNPQPSDPT